MTSYSRNDEQRGSAVVIALTVTAVVVTIGAIAFVLIANGGKNNGIDLGKIGHKTITAATSEEVKVLLTSAKAGDYDAKCTYTDENGDSTIYISGAAKMRVDTTINEKPGHVLRLGDAGYVWADGQKEGSKLPFKSESSTSSKYSPDTFASKVDQYHVKCESVAGLDDSLFTLPTDVTFVDVNSKLNSSSSEPNQP